MFPVLYISGRQWLLIAALTALGWAFPVQSEEALTPLALQGRQIYQQGQDGSKYAINVTLGLTNTTLPAHTFPCINCHGADGEGKDEGNLKIPAITANHLYAPATDTGGARRAYDDDHLAQAISTGQNPGGQPLDAAMPRYHLTKPQMIALLAYLKRLGSAADLDPGLSEDNIQLGSVLPLTGALQATGNLLKATLEACVAEANTNGLIYGRHLSMTIADSASTAEGAVKATQRLLNGNKVFALLARYGGDDQGASNNALAQSSVPDIFPITFMPATTSPATLYALPSYADQARALVDYWVGLPEFSVTNAPPSLVIIIGEQAANLQAVLGIREQAAARGLAIAGEAHWHAEKSTTALETLLAKKPAAIFFLGNAEELHALNALLMKTAKRPVLLSLLAMLGWEALQAHDLAFSKAFLASPFAYGQKDLSQLSLRLHPHGVVLKNPGLQGVTCAAVDVLVEGLKRGGRHVSHLKLLAALATLRQFPVNFLPPLNFTSNTKVGVRGAYIMGINQQGEIISQSEWITPGTNYH